MVTTTAFGSAKLTGPEHQMLNNDVTGFYFNLTFDQGNAWIGCCLSCNAQVWFFDFPRLTLQINHTAHFKHDGSLSRCLQGFFERA